MQTLDHEVLRHVANWLAQGETPWLCTIVRALGSSPRPVGSIVGILDSGQQVGTVSGGCVEEDLLERLRAGEYNDSAPELIEYGRNAEENERRGLPCGGRLTLLLQRLTEGDRAWLDEALAALAQRQCIARSVDLATGRTEMQPISEF